MRKVLIVALVVLLSAISASAYTIVMRDGRRVQIPDQFMVTDSTLTYEVSPGIQVTIQLNTVNIAATERANGEPAGALLRRASAPKPAAPAEGPRTRAAPDRSITNKDLEDYRRARIESEREYENRRKELGLPSREERRREIAAIEERTQEQLLTMRAQEEASEAYWRARGAALRAEIAATEAQLDYVRRRLNEIPLTYSFGAFATTIPFGTVGVAAGPFTQNPFPQFPSQTLTPIIRGTGVQTGFGLNINRGRHPGPGRGPRFRRFPQGQVLALPFQSFDYDFERSELVSQLNGLEIRRAGLKARWRELEEEARRAGAYPGWLR